MAATVNAGLVATGTAWWMPAMQVPGEELDGHPIGRIVLGERALPHTIVVDPDGERFTNEALPYGDVGEVGQTPSVDACRPVAG